jgi:hypothetical protein
MSNIGYIRSNEEQNEVVAESDALGDSVHPKTKESYNKLGMAVPDSAYFAARRPFEKTVKRVKELKGAQPDEDIRIINIYRIKDAAANEWLCYTFSTSIQDMQQNKVTTDYKIGMHPEAYGSVRRDTNFNVISTDLDGINVVYDIKWDVKEFEKTMAMHKGIPSKIELIVGLESYNINSFYGGNCYTIKNADDFKTGTHEELMALGQRGLSTVEPSLAKLKQSIDKDPAYSLAKQQRIR